MFTKFEEFAAASMVGTKGAPPRSNGELCFHRLWEGRAFGMALALSKKGAFEWEDFRQALINSIAEWETSHSKADPEWDYYQRWFLALERMTTELVSPEEVEERTFMILENQKG